jgi:hypothetical protein
MGKPRCARIVAITIGSRTAAVIVKGSPHCGHCSISIANTRLSSRPNSSGRAPREGVPRRGPLSQYSMCESFFATPERELLDRSRFETHRTSGDCRPR